MAQASQCSGRHIFQVGLPLFAWKLTDNWAGDDRRHSNPHLDLASVGLCVVRRGEVRGEPVVLTFLRRVRRASCPVLASIDASYLNRDSATGHVEPEVGRFVSLGHLGVLPPQVLQHQVEEDSLKPLRRHGTLRVGIVLAGPSLRSKGPIRR